MEHARAHPSRLEDEGVPDLQDGTPEQQWAEDPQEMPVPAEHPVAADDYGTTVDEQVRGEPHELRLAREQAEADTYPGEREVGRLVEPDEGGGPDVEKDAVARAAADASGLTAEEEAVHLSDEERLRLQERSSGEA